MTEPSHHAALYNRAKIILWVEDLLTSAYLEELWGRDPRFKFYVGGGHENLQGLVEEARRAGRDAVFSLRDRDFGPTNRPRWRDPEVVNFALETFEIECFLLDPTALAACRINRGRRSADELRARLDKTAGELSWWMACRRVIARLRDARQEHFPRHPKRAKVASRDDATRVLLDNDWVKVTAPGLREHVEPATLCQHLDAAHEHYARHLADGTWVAEFSGKEILGEIRGSVYPDGPAGSAGYEDLAKSVAAAQTGAGRAPAELLELRDALVARCPG